MLNLNYSLLAYIYFVFWRYGALPGSTYHSYLNKLSKLKNKALKIVVGNKLSDSIESVYLLLNVLTLFKCYNFWNSKVYPKSIKKIVYRDIQSLLFQNRTQSQYKVNPTGTIKYSSFQIKENWKKIQFSIKYLEPKNLELLSLNLKHLPFKNFKTNIQVYI